VRLARRSFFVLAVLLSMGASKTTAQTKPSSQTPAKPAQSSAQSSNSQGSGCGYVFPGDGSGITVAMANAMNAAAAQRGCGTGTNIVTNSPITPRTPAGSAYMNALQRYMNAMTSRFAPSLQPGTSDASADAPNVPDAPNVQVSPLTDANSYAQLGKDSISKNIENVLDNCPQAVQYVESKDGLVGEFDKVFAQYKIKKDGIASIEKIKDDLLSDTWWARSSGPEVAIEVKFLANELTNIFGMLSPEGDVVKSIQQLENVTPLDQNASDTIGEFGEYIDNIRTVHEQNGDIDAATKKAAIESTKKMLKHTRYARVVPFIDFAQQFYERAQSEKEAFKLKAEVEYQVRRLNTQINEYQNQIDDYRQAIEAMNAIHDTVIGVCVQKPIVIGNGPKQ
jgi:hypothetical protein